jgi:hypothetical protein
LETLHALDDFFNEFYPNNELVIFPNNEKKELSKFSKHTLENIYVSFTGKLLFDSKKEINYNKILNLVFNLFDSVPIIDTIKQKKSNRLNLQRKQRIKPFFFVDEIVDICFQCKLANLNKMQTIAVCRNSGFVGRVITPTIQFFEKQYGELK